MRSQRRDVGFYHSLKRRDVGSQRRDVGCLPLWNIATLHPNVATLHPNVTTLPCLRQKNTLIFALPLFPLFLNPSVPFLAPLHQPLDESTPSRRRPLFCPPTPSLALPPPVPSTPISPLSLSGTFHTKPRCPFEPVGLVYPGLVTQGWSSLSFEPVGSVVCTRVRSTLGAHLVLAS